MLESRYDIKILMHADKIDPVSYTRMPWTQRCRTKRMLSLDNPRMTSWTRLSAKPVEMRRWQCAPGRRPRGRIKRAALWLTFTRFAGIAQELPRVARQPVGHNEKWSTTLSNSPPVEGSCALGPDGSL